MGKPVSWWLRPDIKSGSPESYSSLNLTVLFFLWLITHLLSTLCGKPEVLVTQPTFSDLTWLNLMHCLRCTSSFLLPNSSTSHSTLGSSSQRTVPQFCITFGTRSHLEPAPHLIAKDHLFTEKYVLSVPYVVDLCQVLSMERSLEQTWSPPSWSHQPGAEHGLLLCPSAPQGQPITKMCLSCGTSLL